MKLLINCSNLARGGGIQVAHSFINEIKGLKDINFKIILSDSLKQEIDINDFPKNFDFHFYNKRKSILNILFGRDKYLDELEKKFQPNTVFTVFGPSYWRPISYHIVGFAKPQYVYNDSPFFNKLSLYDLFKLKLKKIIHLYDFKTFGDEYITESHEVTDELKRIINREKVHTVTNYYNNIFNKKEDWDKLKIDDNDGISLLTISANYPHKNLDVIPSVIDYLNQSYPNFSFQFILTIEEDEFTCLTFKQRKQIVFLGKVQVNQCPYLYKQADFMFLPTLLECFSASYPEAMKMGVPILTSDLPFARGICGRAAKYFDPMSPEDMGEKIYQLYADKESQKFLKEKGYKRLKKFDKPKIRAKKYLDILCNASNHPRPQIRRNDLRRGSHSPS